MTAALLLTFVLGYFLLLLGVAWATSRRVDNNSFFIDNRKSNWGLVAFGMVGTSLSGVTFISVPGAVGITSWHCLQIVLGQWLGYFVIAFVLSRLDLSPQQSLAAMQDKGLATIFNADPFSRHFFAKQVLAGIFITTVMTGLDQEMMQKSISVNTLHNSQKNFVVLSFVLLAVVTLFLFRPPLPNPWLAPPPAPGPSSERITA